jgi:hypothetical protein
MAGLTFKKLLPTFIPLAFEVISHMKRDASHNNNIKKFDKTEEKLSTIENLIVRVEKKALSNREEIRLMRTQFVIWLAINSALLIAVVVKLFFM